MKRFLPALIFFLLAIPVHAVTVSILDYPVSISDDPFLVTVQVESTKSDTNYLRIDLYKESTKNYFGETDNGSYWYGGSNGLEYFPIDVVGGVSTIATFSARMGSPSNTDYPGAGSYLIRARRYTAGGNSGSETPQSQPIEIIFSTPTPEPSPTPTPTPTPQPSPSTGDTMLSPTPSPVGAGSPRPSPDLNTQEGTVAGLTIDSIHLTPVRSPSSRSEAETPSEAQQSEVGPTLNTTRARTALLVGFGLITISVAGFFGYRKYKSLNQL